MTRLFAVLAVAALLVAGPARAEGDEAPNILTPRTIGEMPLDDLFAKLPENAETPTGERIEREILRRFTRSGSATADLLLTWAIAATERKDYPRALDLLDQVIVLKPHFAEAWNRRATVYFLLDNYSASLADLRETLALEPRHFGALSGFGVILQAIDRKEEAMKVFRHALEINPQLDQVRESLERLEKEASAHDI